MRGRAAALALPVMLLATSLFGAVADLVITKTAPLVVNPSSTFTYSMDVTSNGPDTVGPVTVTDVLPPGVTFVSAQTNVAGGTCSGTTTVVCTILLLGPSAHAGVSIDVTAPSSTGPFANTATVSSSASDPNTTNNSSTTTVTVASPGSTADLSVTKSGPFGSLATSSQVVSDITVRNFGPASEPSPVLTDVLPAGATFVAVNPIVGSATCSGTTTIVCSLSPIASGGVVEVAMIYNAPATAGPFTNTATVSGSRIDPNPSNNSSSATATAVAQPFVTDFSITKSGSYTPGSHPTYSIVVTNLGPDTASSAVVTDVLPAGTQLVQVQLNRVGASCVGTTTVVCTFPQFGPGTSVGIFLETTTPPPRSGPITNTASVAAANTDPNPANNSATVTLPVDIPALSPTAMALLALALAAAGTTAFRVP